MPDNAASAPVRAVLFDYGLVLTGPPCPTAWARMLEITGLSEDRFHAAYWAPRPGYDRGDHTGPEYWRQAGAHAGLQLTSTQVAGLIAADTQLWTRPNQPMIDWAARLQAAGTPTGILSNLGDSMMEGVLAQLPWLSGFPHLIWSHTLGIIKPDPAIYLHAASRLATPPAEILFIDDRDENIAGALRAGLQAILYTTQPAFEQELAARGLEELWTSSRNPA